MRVLLLAVNEPLPGVVQSLVGIGIEPVVATARGESTTVGAVRYARLPARGEPGDAIHLRWSRKMLRNLVRDLKPDLIHIGADPWTPTAEAGAAAARSCEIPYVLVGTSCWGGPNGVTARWQSHRVRDGAIALGGISRPALDHLAAGATKLPNAVIPERRFEIPVRLAPRTALEFPTLGVAGRLLPERGIDTLLDALAMAFGEWRLRVAGTGPAQEQLEALAQRHGLSSRIEWLGGIPRSELAGFWPTIDVMVAPSHSTPEWVEPTGSLVLEAMANGVGVIVSHSGALPHVVADGGMIVAEGDVEALARAIAGLVAEPERCRELGEAGRRRAIAWAGDREIAERLASWWNEAVGTGETAAAMPDPPQSTP